MKDSPLMLEGVPYYTVTQFARLVVRTLLVSLTL